MRGRRMRWLLILVLLAVVLPLKPEWVLAARQYQLTLTPVNFDNIAPFSTHIEDLDFEALASWTISYKGDSNPNAPDPVVLVSADPLAANFQSGTSSFPVSRLGLWDGVGAPNYLPLTYGTPIPVSYMITVRKVQETPIPVHMRLALQGTEEPGTYTLTLRVTAIEI